MKHFRTWAHALTIASMIAQVFAPALPAYAATPTPGSTWADSVGPTSANIRVSTSEAAYIRIEYGTSPGAYTMFFPSGSTATQGSTSGYINSTPWYTNEQIMGLTPATMYYYRFGVCGMAQPTECINNPQTAYTYTSERTFTTTQDAPGNVADGKANYEQSGLGQSWSATHNSIGLKWKSPGNSGWIAGNGPSRYIVKMQQRTGSLFQGPNDGGYWASATELPSNQITYSPALPARTNDVLTLSISGLAPNASYRFGVLAVSSAGVQSAVPGIWDIDTTAPVDTYPPAMVAGLSATPSSTSATLTWTAPADPDANSNPQAASRYEIKYREGTSMTEAEWATASLAVGAPAPAQPGTSQTLTIQNLKSGTDYSFAIRAYDALGNVSPLTYSVSTKTAIVQQIDAYPPQHITGVTGYAAITSVTLQWIAPRDTFAPNTAACMAIGCAKVARYEIRYKQTYASAETDWWPSATVVANPPIPADEGAPQYFTVPNLAPSTMYYFSIKSFDNTGNASQFSLPFGIATKATQEGTQPITTTSTPAGAMLSITVKDTNGAIVTGARVEATICGPTSTSPCNMNTLEAGAVAGSYILKNAAAGTYTIRVYPPSSRDDLEMANDTATIAASTSAERSITLTRRATPAPNYGSWPQSKSECENYYGLWCPPTGGSSWSSGSCMMAGQSCASMNPITCWDGTPMANGCPSMPQTESACRSAGLFWCTGSSWSGCSMQACMPQPPQGKMICPDGKNFASAISDCPKKAGTVGPTPQIEYPSLSNVWSGSITQNSATINYSIDRPATVTLEYKSRLDDPWMTASTQTIATSESYSNRTFPLSGLKSGTTYFYRLTATNNIGSSSYPGPNVPPAQFVTAFENTNPGSSLPSGSANLTIIVEDEKGMPIVNATVGVSNCSGSSYGTAVYSTSAMPARACAWASNPTSQSGLVAFTNIQSGEYTIGVSPAWSQNGNREYEYITDRRIILGDKEDRREMVKMKKIGSAVITDLPLSDIRMEHMTGGYEFATWIRWYTPRPASGRIEYGLTAQYEMPPFELPGFASYHEGKIALRPETTYHYRLKSQDERGVMGSTSGTFMTPKSGGDDGMTPFAIAWNKTHPQQGTQLPLADAVIHVEFTKAVDQASLTRDAITFSSNERGSEMIPYAIEPFSNGFNLRVTGRLRENTGYSLSIRPSIKSTSGAMLGGGHQYLMYYTSSGDIDQTKTGSITGTVKLLNGTPVDGATVVTQGRFNQKQITNSKGEYTLSMLPAGTYQLEVYLPSYLGDYLPPRVPNVAVAENQIVKQDIVLSPSEFVIQGLVAYEDGTPVTDALVGAYQTNGGRYIPPTGVDEKGHFKLLISEGTWMVGVMPRGIGLPCDRTGPCPMTVASAMPYVIPSWNAPEKQIVIVDATSKIKDVHFKVAKYKSEATVKGIVAKKDGSAIDPATTKVRISARGGMRNFTMSVELSSDGSFATQLPPGLYEVFVETSDPDVTAPPATELRIASLETKDLGTLFLQSTSLSITGNVRNERGLGLSGLTVQAWNKESGTTLSETTTANGNYGLKVSRGDWIVYVATSDKYSTSQGGTAFIPAKKLPAKNVNFFVQENTAFVRGTIVDEGGAKLSDVSGYVHARPVGKRTFKGFYGMGSPVANGEFSLTLPGGTYALIFEPPQNSRVVSKKDLEITVKSGETQTVALVVEETRNANIALLTGSLVDRSGAIVSGVPFAVYAGSGTKWYNAIGDQQTGSYALKLPAGTWFVGFEIKDDAYSSLFRGSKITVKEQTSQTLNLTVRRATAYMSGKTLDADGNPLPNVSVILMQTGASSYGGPDSTYSDEEGMFEFYVEPGTYAVRAMVGENSDLTNPEEQKVTLVTAGEQTLTFTFKPGTITIKGKTVANGKAVPATVWAWSQNRGMKEFDSDGGFSFKALPNDTWYFSAAADVDRCVYRAEGATLTVGEKKQNTITLELKKTGACLSAPVTVTSDADKPVVVQNQEGAKVVAPANAAATEGTVDVSITPEPVPASQGTERIVGQSYDIRVRTAEGTDIKSFNSDLRVTLPYDPAEVKKLGVKPASLSMKYWDGNAWNGVDHCVPDEKSATLTCSVDHATRFAIVAPPKDVGSPSAKATVRGKNVTLSIAAYDAKKIAFVNVYRSAKNGELGEMVAAQVKKRTLTDAKATAGSTYYYTVRGVDTLGNESRSAKQVKAVLPAKASKTAKKGKK